MATPWPRGNDHAGKNGPGQFSRRQAPARLPRIQDVVLTDKTFDIDFPSVGFGNFGVPWHEPRTFRIHFRAGKAADYVSERIWSDTQKREKQDDGSVILRLLTKSAAPKIASRSQLCCAVKRAIFVPFKPLRGLDGANPAMRGLSSV